MPSDIVGCDCALEPTPVLFGEPLEPEPCGVGAAVIVNPPGNPTISAPVINITARDPAAALIATLIVAAAEVPLGSAVKD